LRKFLIAAIAALASVALVSVAVAQTPSDLTSTTSLTPKKAGTKKKPKAAKLKVFVKNNVPGTTASSIQIDFPKTVKISGKGLTSCALSAFSKPGGKANCPAKSKAGTGITHASLGQGGSGAPLNFNVTAYVGGKNLVVFYIEQIGGGVTKALPGKISKGGHKLVISIPGDVQQPVAGLYGSLHDLQSTLFNKKGKHSLVSSVGCKKKKDTFGYKLTFVPNPNPPSQSSASGTSSASCKK
jgi:hypothetical protein